jgi:hypothetical protein
MVVVDGAGGGEWGWGWVGVLGSLVVLPLFRMNE